MVAHEDADPDPGTPVTKATQIVTTLANNKYFGQCPRTFF